MLLKYINSNRLSVVILFVLLPVIYWIPSFDKDVLEHIPDPGGMPLGSWIVLFNHNFRIVASVLALLLIILNGFLLIQMNVAHIFIPYRTQLPLLFYIVLTVSLTKFHWLSPSLVTSTLLIFLFYRVFDAYKSDKISLKFLDAGLLVGFASLIYFPSIFLFVGLLVTLILIRPFLWREWVFAFIGFLIPYAFTFSIYYLLDIPINDLFSRIADAFRYYPIELGLSQKVFWFYVLVFTVIASYFMAKAIDSMKIHARKFFFVFLAFFLVSLLLFFVFGGTGTGMIFIGAIPLAYLFTHYFVKCKRTWVNDLFFAVFILLLIWQRINF